MSVKNSVPDIIRRFETNNEGSGEFCLMARFWMLHMLVVMGGSRKFVRACSFRDDNIAVALGLDHWIEEDGREVDFDKAAVLREIRTLYREACQQEPAGAFPMAFVANIEKIARLVGLSSVDCRLLEFAVMLKIDARLCEVVDYLGEMSTGKVMQSLSTLLDINEREIRAALHQNALLSRSGLLSVMREGSHNMNYKIDLLSDSFADVVYSIESEPLELLRDTVIRSSPALITLDDYRQIQQHLDILLPYMRHCLQTRKHGVNILLYGPPGVGKTQLTRVLAQEMHTELFEISSEDLDGDPVEGSRRLSSFRAAQYFLSGRQSLLVFDEVEDIFAGGGIFSPRSIADRYKAWMNRMLEANPVPAFWLSNDIGNLDPAFLRRFDMVVEIGWPTRTQRREFLQKQCGDFIETAMIERIADTDNIAPAVTEKSVAVIRAVKAELPPEKISPALQLLVNDTLKSQHHKPITAYNPDKVPELYDPAFINADRDMLPIYQGLSANPSARICLYGPPGTGKTAFGKWLAEKLQKPLHVKRASDLLSMWLGGTEQNIANAFEEAAKEEALLLIDEVDSFLQDRRGASRSWEVTAVNEMLTQMESYNGIFIASTNLMQGLDQASLRRFDLKVQFGYLLPEQAWQLFCRHCHKLGFTVEDALQRRIVPLNNLTPGDFAAVARQNRFSPLQNVSDFMQALVAECAVKENAPGKGMGFIRH